MFSKSALEKGFPKLQSLLKTRLIDTQAAQRLASSIESYTQVQTVDWDSIPKDGSGILVANHSGVWAFDAMVFQSKLMSAERKAKIMLHKFWFQNKVTASVADSLNCITQSFRRALQVLKNKDLLLLFPEEERGNFKSSRQMYRLQSFNPYFVSLAILTQSPIIPFCILGGEEAHINLGKLNFARRLFNIDIPLPLNLAPLPIKWKIIALDPISLKHYSKKDAHNPEIIQKEAADIKNKIQLRIDEERKSRKKFHFLWNE